MTSEQVELQEKKKANEKFLGNQMLYTGFGEIPKSELSKKLQEGKDEFQLVFDKKFGKDSVRAALHFKRSEQDASMYFFNSFDLLLKKDGKEETLQRNFSTFYGNSYTLREAYNMLDGRAVGKNFSWTDKNDKDIRNEEFAWEEIDFISVDDRGNYKTTRYYGFDIEKVVDGYPIKGLEFEKSKEGLINSLKKGNRVSVMMNTSNGEKLVHIEANPGRNSLNLYNEGLKPIILSEKGEVIEKERGNSLETTQANSNAQGQSTDETVSGENKEVINSKDTADAPVSEGETDQKEHEVKTDKTKDQNKDLKNKETVPDSPGNAKKSATQQKNSQSENKSKKQGARTRIR